MKNKKLIAASIVLFLFFLFIGTGFCAEDGKVTMEQWLKIINSEAKKKTPQPQISETVNGDAIDSTTSTGNRGVAVTVYWHMADNADVYLNGKPLREYQPSFKTRPDEAPRPAFSATATLRDGDVFTVGGRRGGSFGLMLIAVDSAGKIVFKTDRESWKVYEPGDRDDWYSPQVAMASRTQLVTVQPDPWYPQKELNAKYGNKALSIWSNPAQTFVYLYGSVALSGSHKKLNEIVFTENFDQGLRNAWTSISAAGGNFARFGRVENGMVLVSVPAGNSWGKTGVRTLQPIFKVDDTMKANPMQIVLDFDPDNTTGYIAAIAPESHPDVVHATQSWFHWYRRPNGEAGIYLRNFRTNQTASLMPPMKAPATAPRQIVFSVRPGSVEVSTSSGEKFTLTQEWLMSGTPVYLHVHSHPGPEGDPASFALDTVTVGR